MRHGNPYVGPVPFSSADRDRFFGRARETRILTGMVMSCRAVLLFAQSGAGKSSIVQAGLLPALEGLTPGGGAPSGRLMRVLGNAKVSIRPPHPVRDPRFNPFVYSTLACLDRDSDPERLIEAACDTGLEHLLLRLLEEAPTAGARPVPALLIFDQFEELFTHFQEHWQARAGFFVQLAGALARSPSLHLLFSMREDFIAELTPFASLMPEQLDARLRLERLGLAAALEAVRAPAWLAGRPFAEGVAEKLVLNLARLRSEGESEGGGRNGLGEPSGAPGTVSPDAALEPPPSGAAPAYGEWVEPMHLQIVCHRLWNATGGEPAILEQHVEQSADVDQVLSDFYEDALAAVLAAEAQRAGVAAEAERAGVTGASVGLDDIREQDLRTWFETELLTPTGMRGLVFQDAERTGSLPNRAVRILDARYLVRPILHGRARGYELSHDRLIAPILRSNRAWWDRHPLARTAAAWANTPGNRDSLLLSGPELPAAEKMLADHPGVFSRDVELFVAESRAALEYRLQEEEAHRRREQLEQQRQAEIDQEKRRRMSLRRWLLLILSGALLAALTAVMTLYQYRAADSARQEAERARAEVELALGETDEARKEAEVAREEADALRESAEEGWMRATHESQKARNAQLEAEKNEAEAEHELLRNRDANWMRLAQNYLTRDPGLAGAGLLEVCAPSTTPAWSQLALDVLHLPRALHTLNGFNDAVLEVAFSSDGTRLLTASADHTARGWILRGGHPSPDGEPAVLHAAASGNRHGQSSVVAVRFSRDGRRVAMATADGFLSVRRLEANSASIPLPDHTGLVSSMAFNPDGSRLAAGSVDGTVRIWGTNAAGAGTLLSGHQGPVTRVEFSPDGKWLATSSADKTIRIWPIDGGAAPRVLAGHTDVVFSVTFSADGKRLLSASRDGTARVWPLEGGVPTVLSARSAELRSAAFSPDGRYVVATGSDGNARIWPSLGGTPVALGGHEGGVRAIELNADGSRILTVSEEGTARLWSGLAESDPLELRGHVTRVLSAHFSPDGRWVATGSADHTAKLWPVSGLRNTLVFRGGRSPVFSAALSADETRLAAAGYDGMARIWPVGRLEPPIALKHGQPVSAVAFSPSGWFLGTGALDGSARAYRADQLERPLVFWGASGHRAGVTAVRFAPDGERLLSASNDRTARIWPLGGGAPTVLEGHAGPVTAADFSPDGQQVATGSTDRSLLLWRPGSRTPPLRLTGHGGPVLSVRFSASGREVLSVSADGSARIWSASSGAPLRTLRAGRETLHAGDFDRTGRLVLTGASTGAVVIRPADGSGEPHRLGRHADAVYSVAFSRSGAWVVTGSADGTARLWPGPFLPVPEQGGWPVAVRALREKLYDYVRTSIPEEQRQEFIPDIHYPDRGLGCRQTR